jgi:hypothetical protein
MNTSSTELSQLLTTNRSLGTSRYIASGRTTRKTRLLLFLILLGVFPDPLPSNKRPIVAQVGSRGNVFTESLPSNGSIRHNILSVQEIESRFPGHTSLNVTTILTKLFLLMVSVTLCS